MAQPGFTTGWNPSQNVTQPSALKKALGWLVNEKPAGSYFNWLLQTIELWLIWLQGVYGYDSAWTGAHSWTATESGPLLSVNNTGTGLAASILASSAAEAVAIQNSGTGAVLLLTKSSGSGSGLVASVVNGAGVSSTATGSGIAIQALAATAAAIQASSASGYGLQVSANATRAAIQFAADTGGAGDPSTASDGDTYYNLHNHTFRVYVNGTWKSATLT